MTTTPHLSLPLIAAAQAQKHVTHNEALLAVDALLHCAVKDKDLAAPPVSPAEGDRYIVAASPTGAWAGKAGQVAARQDGVWRFYAPQAGWIAFVVDEMQLYHFDGIAWAPGILAITNLQNLALLGVGAMADTGNPLSTRLNNVLHAAKTIAEGGTGDVRVKLSKEAAAKTASHLFQTNFSSRAELGLTGDDNFHIKTSADGSGWVDALVLAAATGNASLGGALTIAGALAGATTGTFSGLLSLSGGASVLGGNSLNLYEASNANGWRFRNVSSTLKLTYLPTSGDALALDPAGRIGLQGGTTNASVRVHNSFPQDEFGLVVEAAHAAFTKSNIRLQSSRAQSTAYNFLDCISGAAGALDFETVLRGDGNNFCDGAWTGGGADRAEMLPWAAGVATWDDHPWYTTVVLEHGYIRPATADDDPRRIIGAVSPTYDSLGNNPLNWPGRWELDGSGRPVEIEVVYVQWQEDETSPDLLPTGRSIDRLYVDGEPPRGSKAPCLPADVVVPGHAERHVVREKLRSGTFIPGIPYATRLERPKEWAPIGLLGILRVGKDRPVNPAWVAYRRAAAYDEYLAFPAVPPESILRAPSAIAFRERLTGPERLSLIEAARTDAVLMDILLAFAAAQTIDPSDPRTREAMAYIVGQGHLSDERAAEILAA
ncbi:MAG TPA: DUF2793 domain-containing protein [Beijerinckiaceae bacterium]|jgi:hypothetical protein